MTMRRLASDLDTGPASLYVYIRNRDELLNALLDRVGGMVELEEPDPGALARAGPPPGRAAVLRVMEEHRGIARVAVANVPTGESALRLADNLLGLLLAGGVSPRDAAWACDVIPLFITCLRGRDRDLPGARRRAGRRRRRARRAVHHAFRRSASPISRASARTWSAATATSASTSPSTPSSTGSSPARRAPRRPRRAARAASLGTAGGVACGRANPDVMTEHQSSRTLVKSAPELWAECSDAASLARHLGAFGEIRITKLEPETAVAWEGAAASGTVRLEPSGWGTRVTLTVTEEARRPSRSPRPLEPEPAAEPRAARARARARRRGRA